MKAKPVKILGVSGTVQTGKSELRQTFEECGWIFHDLNDPQCDLRAQGTRRYEMFMSKFPGCLKECGSKTGLFYDLVTSEFYQARVREDIELLVPITLKLCNEAGNKPVALSWEYLPFIAKQLPLDHTLLFESEQEIWMKRLHARLAERGVTGEITEKRIIRALDILDVWPKKIREHIEREMVGNFTIIDVSSKNWGADRLSDWLKSHT